MARVGFAFAALAAAGLVMVSPVAAKASSGPHDKKLGSGGPHGKKLGSNGGPHGKKLGKQ